MDPSVFIDGTPAAELGGVKSLGFTRSYAGGQGGGFRDARLSLDLEPGFQHPSLHLNALVELRHGADSLGKGNIVSIDRNTWEIVIDGIVRLGEDYESRTNTGVPAGLATGLPAAIGRGLPWVKDPALVLPGDVVGQSMQSITDALNDFATQQNKSWLIDGDTLRLIADPTTPSLMLMATDNPNSSTDGLVSVVTAKYAGAVDESGNPALISYVTVEADDAPKRVERTIDLTSNGAMTAADATAQAKAALTSGATSPLTESVSVAAGTLFTAAGDDLTDILCTVREGQMVRQLDWVNPDGSPGLYRDWIIGGVDWSTDGGLVLTPVGGAPATFQGTIIDLRQGVDSAQSAASTALAVGTPDYLQSLITATSVTTMGALPASAAIGDLCVIDGKPYVCTLAYASGGTLTANWIQATDPRTVALISATATAVFKADNANTAAQTAQASADGKNSVTYAASAPSSSSPGRVGDTWFVFSGAQITAQYKLASVSGSTYTWSSVQLNSAVIANIDAGKITTGVLSAIDISGVNITGSTITGTTIAGGTVTGATVKTSNTSNYWALGNDYVGGNTLRGVLSNGGIAAIDYSIVGTGGQLSITNQASSVYSGITLTSASGTQSVSIDTGTIALNGSVSAGALTASGAVSLSGANLSTPSMPVGTIGSTAGFSGSSSAQMIRSSSGRKYKVDVHNLTDAPQAIGSSILEIEPVRYRDRYAVEQYIDTDTGETGEPRWWVGWTAEQFIDAGWGDLAIRDPESGDPEGLMYERVLPALVPELRARFEAIEAENASLRSKVGQLESTLVVMASRLTALENK